MRLHPAASSYVLETARSQITLACALLGCLIGPALAQTAPPSPPDPTTLHSTTTLVLVPALVETEKKEIVYALTADDFELTDNGVPQRLTLEADAADSKRPLALVVAVQIGGAAQRQFGKFAHLDTMLAGMIGGAPNQVALVEFDSHPEYDSSFTSDVAAWSDAFNHPVPGDGGAAIFDGLAFALDMLRVQPSGTRRAVLLISQQHDDGSKARVQDILREASETNTAVYSLTFSVEKATLKDGLAGFTHLTHTGPAPPPIQVGDFTTQGYFNLLAPAELAVGAMRKNFAAEVASLSGGEPLDFSNKAEFDRALNTLTNHIRNGYTLSFRPTSNEPGLHTLKLRVVDHPELHIDARANYWADGTAKAPE
jgi:VWFA-related protein